MAKIIRQMLYDISYHKFPTRLLKLIIKRDILVNEIFECARFYLTAYGVRNLFATLPRSGYGYAMCIINSAWDILHGGTGDYYYREGEWKSPYRIQAPFDWRTPVEKKRFPNSKFFNPVIFHTHSPYHSIMNFQKCNMKVVVLVRDLFDQLKSYLFHLGYNASNQDEFIHSKAVDSVIDFLNSWGKFIERHEALVVKYEELAQDPFEIVKSTLLFWGLCLPESCVQVAVAKCSREEMLKRIPQNEVMMNPRISVRNHRGIFSDASIKFIRNRIERRLRYSFGYSY